MRILFILIIFIITFLYSAEIKENKWRNGETLLTFFKRYKIPLNLYYNLDKEEQELVSEIVAGVEYQLLYDEDDKLEQILIPIGDESQIHIVNSDGNYSLSIIPISYIQKNERLVINIKNSPYIDIVRATNSSVLANELLSAFKGGVNFKNLKKNDTLVIVYNQKIRLGRPFGTPQIKASMLKTNNKETFVFLYEDKYYDEDAKEIENFLLTTPVTGARISSTFSLNRYHPVLKIYRPHFGVDYSAPVGTPVKAAGDGKITFRGVKNGYGNTIEIAHMNGYKTIYAHLNSFNKSIKDGRFIKKEQVIGYVGSTGLSSGPHLHFGLYRNNKPINPLISIKVENLLITGKDREKFLDYTKQMKSEVYSAIADNIKATKYERIEYHVKLNEQHINKDYSTKVHN
ncbi:MAG: peptidoglycan DD-metalloendopeptidase family protein [Campylobacterales bacterium]|nr:peptidoglycan DD-metalloendopeptidase family protein [Campylobacterales bacterium]